MDEETPAPMRRAVPSSSYVMSAGMGRGGTISRIREPHPHDVLSGRGGSINSHIGNKVFRDWIHERKDSYNLAMNKAEKARVSREVIDLVKQQDPPGRFLTRDPNSSSSGPTWWIEIDDVKAMAKTSQALREGAPAIRAKFKDELKERKQRGSRGTKRRAATSSVESVPSETAYVPKKPEPEPVARSAVWPEPAHPELPHEEEEEEEAMPSPHEEEEEEEAMPPPPVVAMSNEMAIEALRTAAEAAKHGLGVPADDKRSAILLSNALVHHEPSEHYGEPEHHHEPEHHDFQVPSHPFKKARVQEPVEQWDTETPPLMPMAHEDPKSTFSLSGIDKADKMKRAHSLALSDINDGDLEFVNPFEEENASFLRSTGGSNHSFGHQSFSSLPKLSSSELSSRNRSNGNNSGSPYRKNVSNRSVSVDENTPKCFCECGNPVLDGGVCPCGALADHLVWRDDHIEDEDWLHISGFMDQIVPVSP